MHYLNRKLGVLIGALGVFAIADAQLDFYDTNVVFTGSYTRPLAGQGSGAFISPDDQQSKNLVKVFGCAAEWSS